MIVVRIELHSAITGEVSEISRVVIYNKGNGSKTRGNYGCNSYRKGSPLRPLNKNIVRKGEVENHARLSEPVLNLVSKALRSMGYF